MPSRRWPCPWGDLVLAVGFGHPHTDDLSAPRRLLGNRLYVGELEALDGGKESPLVRIRPEELVNELGVAVLARLTLKRKRDQIPEPAFGHGVLVREETVVRLHRELVSAGHGVRDQEAAHLSRHLRRHRSREEEPGVGAVSGTGALHGYRNSVSLARLAEGRHVFLPALVVEVHGEEPARLVLEHGIDAHDLLALEVLEDFCIVDRQEGLVRAFTAGRPAAASRALLLADAADPFVGASG